MKKTLLVTMDFYPSVGGVAEYWKGLSRHMPRSEWVVLAPELPVGVFENDVAYTLHRRRFFSKWMWPRWIRLIFTIIRLIKKEHIRCIIAGQLLPVGSAVRVVSFLTGTPYVVSLHGMDLGMAARSYRKFATASGILKHARTIIVNSSDTARRALQFGVSESCLSVVYPCADMPPSSHRTRSGERYPILFTLARLVRRKGIQYVLEALSDIVKAFPSCMYVIAGGGQMRRELAQSVRSRGLENHVIFTGIISDEKKAEYFGMCDIFVMTPYEERGDVEGFGMVYLEANSYGKPVIATHSGGISDAVIDGKTGLLIEEKNSKAITDAVVRLARDPDLSQRLGKQGYDRVKEEFQWGTQSDKLRNILTYL